jgi:hypothetical protein
MNKVIISSIIASFFLMSITSAALGIGFPKEINQEKDTEMENTLALFTFGDKNDKAILTVNQGQNCVSFPDGNQVDFQGKDTAYVRIITKTTEDCDNAEVKIQLSPATASASTGTVGMNLAIVKSFVIKSVSPTTSTIAIIAITALVLAVLVLVAAMVKIAKKKD